MINSIYFLSQRFTTEPPMAEDQVWTYSIVGALFIFYFFAILLQRSMNTLIRMALSIFFLSTGTFFFNLAGRIITGYYEPFTLITISNAIIMGAAGFLCVFIFYQENKTNRDKALKP